MEKAIDHPITWTQPR